MTPVARSDDEGLAALIRGGSDKANGVIPPERREEVLIKHPLTKVDEVYYLDPSSTVVISSIFLLLGSSYVKQRKRTLPGDDLRYGNPERRSGLDRCLPVEDTNARLLGTNRRGATTLFMFFTTAARTRVVAAHARELSVRLLRLLGGCYRFASDTRERIVCRHNYGAHLAA
jgi:hypothetical protein